MAYKYGKGVAPKPKGKTKDIANQNRKATFTFKTFEEANDFAKLKDGQVFKEKNSWKVRIARRAK